MTEEASDKAVERNHLEDFGKIAGEILHDLANEIQVLSGWATLARVDAEQGKLAVDEIKRLSRMADSLGRMLQDVVATIAGQTLSPEVNFDPAALTEMAVNDRMLELVLSEVRFKSRLPPGVRVSGRASFWIRIVGNLLANAGRHARARVYVSVELDQSAPGGNSVVVLRVEDDGPGVPQALEAVIFQTLWKGDSPGAAGLGLSSAVWAASQLGGSLGYAGRAKLGGACFELRVPATTSLAGRGRAPLDPHTLLGMRILLVERDAPMRASLGRLLRRSGAEVRELDPSALTREAILDEVLNAVPDAIVLDLHAGDGNGVGVWSGLFDDIPRLAERVVYMTAGAASDPALRSAVRSGRQVLAKPFDISQLISAILELRPRN